MRICKSKQITTNVVTAQSASASAASAAQTATTYITAIDQNGIKVHAENSPTTNYTQINANGMSVYQNVDGTATEVASFGANGAQVGRSGAGHTIVNSDGMRVYGGDGSELLAQIGYGDGLNPSGLVATAPYYTLGDRSSNNSAVGNYSVSVGHANVATGFCAYVEGWGNDSTGLASHAEGHNSDAIGNYSHAGGFGGYASGEGSFSSGFNTRAESDYQTVIGKYNTPDSNNTYCFIIGNGRSSAPYTSNALTVDWSGNLIARGGATLNGNTSITGTLNATGAITQNGTAVSLDGHTHSSTIVYEDETVSISYSAGTIGTRGTQVNCGTTAKSGYTYIGECVLSHTNTAVFSVNLIRNDSTENVHLMAYRANGNAVTNAEVIIRKIWIKNGFVSAV